MWTQITGTSQKSPFCSQTNSDAVIEQMMRSTEFVKITVVYGHTDENGRFVRKMRFAYGQMNPKWLFVRKIRVKSWRIAQNKKKSVPTTAQILIII